MQSDVSFLGNAATKPLDTSRPLFSAAPAPTPSFQGGIQPSPASTFDSAPAIDASMVHLFWVKYNSLVDLSIKTELTDLSEISLL